MPDKFCVVGVARKGMSNDDLRDSLMKGLRQFATRPVDDAIAKRLLECVTSIEADPKDPASFDAMREQLEKLEAARKTGGNRLFYLATPPNAFAPISRELGRTGMLKEERRVAAAGGRKAVRHRPRLGQGAERELLKIVDEHQIYRIDHYLGKETVQNILVLRFANGMFEPIWNRNHIDHVQITVDEKLGVGHRGSFYDADRRAARHGAEPSVPVAVAGRDGAADRGSTRIRCARKRPTCWRRSRPRARKRRCSNSVRGQYRGGKIGDTEIEDYRKTEDVKPDSTTETYAALKLTIDNWRWAGVPFYLRTGKALGIKRTEVAIKFKQAPFAMFS